jgi:hypothetical protein
MGRGRTAHGAPADLPSRGAGPGGGRVIGIADDGAGVQALVVGIEGTTRWADGSTYHVTWSLAPGRGAAESNDVLHERGWAATGEQLRVCLKPKVFGGYSPHAHPRSCRN